MLPSVEMRGGILAGMLKSSITTLAKAHRPGGAARPPSKDFGRLSLALSVYGASADSTIPKGAKVPITQLPSAAICFSQTALVHMAGCVSVERHVLRL